jgi:hypothetical protein
LLLGSLSRLLLGSLALAECRLLVPRDGDLAPPRLLNSTAPQVSVAAPALPCIWLGSARGRAVRGALRSALSLPSLLVVQWP